MKKSLALIFRYESCSDMTYGIYTFDMDNPIHATIFNNFMTLGDSDIDEENYDELEKLRHTGSEPAEVYGMYTVWLIEDEEDDED